MKKLLVVAALGLAVAYVAGAWSAPSATPTEKKLQRDVKVLQSQVRTLQKNVKALKKEDGDLEAGVAGAIILWFCGLVVTADDLQGTWLSVDQLSAATQAGKTYFGPQVPVSDGVATFGSICQEIGVPRSQALPPSTAQITALLAIIQRGGSSSNASLLRDASRVGLHLSQRH